MHRFAGAGYQKHALNSLRDEGIALMEEEANCGCK